MSIIISHSNLHYKTTNKILRSISIHSWRSYFIKDLGTNPRNDRCFIIYINNDIIIRLYDRASSWGIEYSQTVSQFNEDEEYRDVKTGLITTKNEGALMLLYSVLSHLSAKNPVDFNITEYRLFNLLKHYFNGWYNHRRALAVSNWKANAIA